MNDVQRAMLPDSRPEHLAEFFLSGLIQREEGAVAGSAKRYYFLPGLDELLRRDLPRSSALEVLRIVSCFVDRRTNEAMDFHAIVADPAELQQAQTSPKARCSPQWRRRC